MKFSTFASALSLAAAAAALPSRHSDRNAPIALVDSNAGILGGLVQPAVTAVYYNPRADRDAQREERRKEWHEWSRETGANGASNGANFVNGILDGVSGIIDSAVGPVYSFFGGGPN
ncbi:hypothetical protein FBU59_004662 [Linderina macrospora]|uniref:Uncharacterized protein n=1 Tax=Linderina macrospora TaxID=4868 RepID=A0ACC1J551_9FUNG|nr:hypothetical protein FBU59_004662 [Linderina macrospora]